MGMGSKKEFTFQRDKPKKKTVGKAVHDIITKEQAPITVGEVLDEYQHEYLEEILTCIRDNRSKYESPFYIIVLTKKEPWALNVMRNWFIARQTRPSARWMRSEFPNFMQTVYAWDDRSEQLRLLWSLPTWQDALVVLKNKDLYDPQLVKWIIEYESGVLDQSVLNENMGS